MRHDADYGLHACALSSNAERARRVAERIDAGRIAINGAPLVPLGGFKRSGIR
jgi:aldehyde dehydrogenase (NAD+)